MFCKIWDRWGGWERVQREDTLNTTYCSRWYSSAWITDCVTTFPSQWEKKAGLGSWGGFGSSWKTKTINMPSSYSRFLSLPRCMDSGEMAETLLVFLFCFPSADKRQCGWHGQGSTVAWLVHSSPLRPTRHNSTHTHTHTHSVSGWAQSNNNISLLHSLLALSKGPIQRIAASPYLHTNKREDVDGYRCPPPLCVPACLWLFARFLPLSFFQKAVRMSD